MLRTAVAEDVTFDAVEFRRVLLRGVGDGRASAATRTAARSASAAAAAATAMSAFAAAAADDSPAAPDVVAAYTDLCPAAPELFAALYLSAVRPAAAAAALDCLLAIARYARAAGAAARPRPRDAVDRARSLVKDVVKGRAPALFDALSAGGGVAARALALLTEVTASRPLLAKEAVNRFDLGAHALCLPLCAAPGTSTPFTDLLVALLSSGDHDVVYTLATRSRHAMLSPLVAARERGAAGPDPRAVDALLLALTTRVLPAPSRAVARSALEPPMLETTAALAAAGRTAAAALLSAALAAPPSVVPTAHAARVLAAVPISASTPALNVALDGVRACPRAARMLLQTGPHVFAEPALTSTWLAAAAVICCAAAELRTPTPVFARARFVEKCWAHASPLVRHYGALVAAALCRVVAQQPKPLVIARTFLPAPALLDTALRKAGGEDTVLLRVYGDYRSLFRKDFDDLRSDAIRVAMDAGYGKKPSALGHVVRASLHLRPNDALSTLFNRRLFSALLREVVCEVTVKPAEACDAPGEAWLLVKEVMLATGLFPEGTEHEVAVWISVVTSVGAESTLAEFESFLAGAWSKPYALFDDLTELSQTVHADEVGSDDETDDGIGVSQSRPLTSLLTAAGLRRIEKLGTNAADACPGFAPGSLGDVLGAALEGICLAMNSRRLASAVGNRVASIYSSRLAVASHQGRLVSVARRLASSDTDEATVFDLIDCVSADTASAVVGIASRHLLGCDAKVWNSSTGCASILNLLLRLTCYDAVVAEPLSLLVLSAQRDSRSDNPAALFAASLLKSRCTLSVRHAALRVLCSLWDGGAQAMVSDAGLVEYGRLAIARSLSSSARAKNRLDPCQLEELLVSILTGMQGSVATRSVLELLSKLTSHGDASVRAAALAVPLRLFESGKARLDLACLSTPDAAMLQVLVSQFPFLRECVIEYASSPALESPASAMTVLPAIAWCCGADEERGEVDAVLPRTGAALIAALLSPSRLSLTSVVSVSERDLLSSCVEFLLPRLLRGDICPHAVGLIGDFLRSQSDSWTERPSLATEATISSIIVCSIFRAASSKNDVVLKQVQSHLVNLLVAFPDSAISPEKSGGAELLACMLESLKVNNMLASIDMKVLEVMEKCVPDFLAACTKGLSNSGSASHSEESQVAMLRVIVASFQLDLMIGKMAGAVLSSLSDAKVAKTAIDWLARAVSACVHRLGNQSVSADVAQSLVKLEDVFSETYQGLMTSRDRCILQAMQDIAAVMKSSGCRSNFLLSDRRHTLFQVNAADVLTLLSARQLEITADSILCVPVASDVPEAIDPYFALTVLRRGACEAEARPNVAVLDLEHIARNGLIGIAITGLASADEQLRMLSYAALGALTKAVGPESGVARDAASALYRDRRQLAFLLNLLRTSIRSPLERLLPLFAMFFRHALGVVLRPTHGAYREVTRFLLRTPLHNVHDADGLSCLFREESESCRSLALTVMKHGIRSGEDHHVARRRHMYDTVLMLGIQFPAAVLSLLTTIAGKCDGQVSADLVRSYGVLSWIMGDCFGSNALLPERLALLTELARVLPRGVLCDRYAPSFARALEELALHQMAGQEAVANAVRCIAALAPDRRNAFDLPPRHRCYSLASAVYAKSIAEQSQDEEQFVVSALLSCSSQAKGQKGDSFPATAAEKSATLAFAAATLLQHQKLRSAPAVRSAVACLLFVQSRTHLDSCLVIALLATLPVDLWPTDLHALADLVPGAIPQRLSDLRPRTARVDRRTIVRAARRLLPKADAPPGTPASGGRDAKRRKT